MHAISLCPASSLGTKYLVAQVVRAVWFCRITDGEELGTNTAREGQMMAQVSFSERMTLA